jgi:uncharacterized membrane protein
MSNRLELCVRNLVLLGTTALLIAIWWRVLSAGMSVGKMGWAIACTSPLWIALPWLARQSRKAYATLTLCVIPYLIVGITEAIANPLWRAWAALVLCVSFLLFVSLIAYLRVTRPALTQ